MDTNGTCEYIWELVPNSFPAHSQGFRTTLRYIELQRCLILSLTWESTTWWLENQLNGTVPSVHLKRSIVCIWTELYLAPPTPIVFQDMNRSWSFSIHIISYHIIEKHSRYDMIWYPIQLDCSTSTAGKNHSTTSTTARQRDSPGSASERKHLGGLQPCRTKLPPCGAGNTGVEWEKIAGSNGCDSNGFHCCMYNIYLYIYVYIHVIYIYIYARNIYIYTYIQCYHLWCIMIYCVYFCIVFYCFIYHIMGYHIISYHIIQ